MTGKRIEKKGWRWAPVPIDVIMSPHLSHADVRVYAYLLWRAGEKEHTWPSVETMASDLHMSNSAVRLSLRNLIKHNWIARKRIPMRSSVTYVFESQKDCVMSSANLLADDQLTGWPTMRQQVSRLNESHINESQGERGARSARGASAPPPPAIAAFREAAKAFPAKSQWPAIVEAVGEDAAALDLWRKVVEGYVLLGWNPRNVAGMLDFFKRGEVPRPKGNGRAAGDPWAGIDVHEMNRRLAAGEI